MVELNKEDKELEQIFSGEEKPLHPDMVHVTLGKPQKAVSKKETTTQKAKDKPVEEQWQPTREHNWMDNLKNCVQWVIGFGGLSFLLFYWEQAGLMAESIAVPCMCLCTALAGWGLGKNVRCK